MEQHPQHLLYSIFEEITPQDHHILRNGGTSSNIECLPSRLQQSKTPLVSRRRHIENLTYEIGYLKAELAWHKESKRALLQLQDQMYEMLHKMEDALAKTNVHLQEAEKRYLSFWGLSARAGVDENMIWSSFQWKILLFCVFPGAIRGDRARRVALRVPRT